MDTLSLSIIAHIHTPFAEKFGVPRQSGLAPTAGWIVFAPEYRNPDALRGLEGFSHLWLVWVFDQAIRKDWSPRCGRPVWAATSAWACSPPALPSGPTPSA